MTTAEQAPRSPDDALFNAPQDDIAWHAWKNVTHCDPAGRGLASFRQVDTALPLDAGQLRAAAHEVAARGANVGIVTGFGLHWSDGVTAETDGPPGALFLARAGSLGP